MDFNTSTIWITGASSGIGKALTLELNKRGATIIASSRKADALESTKSECANPSKIHVLPLDLSENDSLSLKVNQAITLVDKIDVMVHCGGISQRSLILDTDIEVDRRVMEIDYFGTVILTKAILPHFKKNQSGHFVVVTSLMGKFSSPLRSGYCAAKHALHGFFDALRAEHHDDNIAVTMVCPGFISTNISKNALTGQGAKQGTMDEATGAGMTAERCAYKMANSIAKRKAEVYIGGKEILAIYLKRYFPGILRRIIRKTKVT